LDCDRERRISWKIFGIPDGFCMISVEIPAFWAMRRVLLRDKRGMRDGVEVE
jgi:hypothetical protein